MTSPDVEFGTAPNQEPVAVTAPEAGETRDVAFFNAQDGIKGRDGGPYLDYVERYNAEVHRARMEGREAPEYGENVPAHVGTSLVTAPFVIDNSSTSNPSMAGRSGLEAALNDETFNSKSLADPVSVLPVQFEGQPGAVTDEDNDDDLLGNDNDEDDTPVV